MVRFRWAHCVFLRLFITVLRDRALGPDGKCAGSFNRPQQSICDFFMCAGLWVTLLICCMPV